MGAIELRGELYKYIEIGDRKFLNALHKTAKEYIERQWLNRMIAEGEEDIAAGRTYSLEEVKKEVKVSIIGQWENQPELSSEENLKMRILLNFLNDEFTRDVGQGTEFLYRSSERIAKAYFDLSPRDVQDAWCYPSIASKPSFNVCFRPELAKETLNLVGVQLCEVEKDQSDYMYKCIGILADFDENNIFKFHKIGSKRCAECRVISRNTDELRCANN